MFCANCAARLSSTTDQCGTCGSPRLASVQSSRASTPVAVTALSGSRLRRAVELLPVVAIASLAAVLLLGALVERRAQARSYRAAVAAEEEGRLLDAAGLFADAGDFSDAPLRAQAVADRIAPLSLAYEDAVVALSVGDYDDAIAGLLPIVQHNPEFLNAAELLDDARSGREGVLLREARDAEARQDWLRAEQLYAELVAANPEDGALATHLLDIRRRHAPYVFSLGLRLHLASPANGHPRIVSSDVKAAWPIWSPDRRRIAFVSPGDQQNGYVRSLFVIDADGSNLRKLADDPARWRAPIWSPDGTRIAFEVDGTLSGDPTSRATVKIVDVNSGIVTDIIGDAFPNGSSPAWSPTGDRIAFVVRGFEVMGEADGVPKEIAIQIDASAVYVLTFATGEIAPLGRGDVPAPWRLTWSPGGDDILVFCREDGTSFDRGTLYKVNAVTGVAGQLDRSNVDLSMPVWSPDGSRFAYVLESSIVRVISSDGGVVEVSSPIPLSGSMTWSPSGDRLLATGGAGDDRSALIDLGDGAGDVELIELAFDRDGGDAGPPQWSPANPEMATGLATTSGTAFDR